jgi:hypothetical protein
MRRWRPGPSSSKWAPARAELQAQSISSNVARRSGAMSCSRSASCWWRNAPSCEQYSSACTSNRRPPGDNGDDDCAAGLLILRARFRRGTYRLKASAKAALDERTKNEVSMLTEFQRGPLLTAPSTVGQCISTHHRVGQRAHGRARRCTRRTPSPRRLGVGPDRYHRHGPVGSSG